MTDIFYVAVKGSLHSSDSSVFGLNNEEIGALTKKFNDVQREVINGVLIKANPLKVINSLSELGYRVACSSGEAEIVWTLRREVLDQDFTRNEELPLVADKYPETFPLSALREAGRKSERKISTTEESVKKSPKRPPGQKTSKEVERIGTKPEDLAEYLGYSGSRILVTSPEDVDNVPEGQKIIIKTNENSENNPMVLGFRDDDQNTIRSKATPVLVNQVSTEKSHPNMSFVGAPPIPSVHQTLDEMDFERGLWYPALTGDLPRITNLLQKGSDPNTEDKNGYTPLHYAARCGFTTICTKLLEAGASVNKTTRAGGSTPLHRAALAGTDDTIIVLIKYGANLLAKDADGRIPLHRAVEANHPTSVALLLEALPESSVVKDRSGKTPRHYVHPNNKIMVELFSVVEKSHLPTGKSSNSPKIHTKSRDVQGKDATNINKSKPQSEGATVSAKQTEKRTQGTPEDAKDEKTQTSS